MSPLIRPFRSPETPMTEYQKERAAFAKLQADLRRRMRAERRRVALGLARRALASLRAATAVGRRRSA